MMDRGNKEMSIYVTARWSELLDGSSLMTLIGVEAIWPPPRPRSAFISSTSLSNPNKLNKDSR